MDITENQTPLAVPQKELDTLKAKMARTMLNVTQRTVEGLEKLSLRLDGLDDALALKINLDEASPQQLMLYFQQMKDSFRLRQDFLKALSGYDVDTTKVAVEKVETDEATTLSEDDAERIRNELLRRSKVAQAIDVTHEE